MEPVEVKPQELLHNMKNDLHQLTDALTTLPEPLALPGSLPSLDDLHNNNNNMKESLNNPNNPNINNSSNPNSAYRSRKHADNPIYRVKHNASEQRRRVTLIKLHKSPFNIKKKSHSYRSPYL